MSEYILGLDIGSVEIRAIIAKKENGLENNLSICGIGKSKTYGVKKGVITNIEQAANSIKFAVSDAVKSAGRKYDRVIVSISGAYTKSVPSQGVISVPDHEIGITEIKRAMQMAEHNANVPSDYVKLHILPYDFKVDEQDHIEDPLGMSGNRLEVSTHIVIVPESSVKNLTKSVEMAGIKIDNIVLSGYASAISTLSKDEKDLGVALIDMGGATCDMVVHLGNSLRYNDVLPIGSTNITNDLSKAIHTPLPYAEEIKLSYEDLLIEGKREIELPVLGEDEKTHSVSLEIITNVILARIEETIMLLARKLDESGFKDKIGAGIVLTGGMTKLEEDVRDLATAIFDNISIRIAKPRNVSGLYEIAKDSANSCAIGLCLYGFGEFTPYEIDSNGELRYKDEVIKSSNSNDIYAKEIATAIDSENNKEVEVGIDKHDMTLPKLPEPNILKKFWNYIKHLF